MLTLRAGRRKAIGRLTLVFSAPWVLALGCGKILGLGDERELASAPSGNDASLSSAGSAGQSGVGGGSSAGNSSVGAAGGGDAGSAGASGANAGSGGGSAGAGMAGVDAGGADSGAPPVPSDCTAIKASNPNAASGVYQIDPDGAGPMPQMSAYCDQDTDGGGWTLVLNYVHAVTTNPDLELRTKDLPLLGSSTLGSDESGTDYWGHAAPALVDALRANELRFYGRSSAHNRILHFKTTLASCIAYARTGFYDCRGLANDFTPLAGHSTNLPLAARYYRHNYQESALTFFTFYLASTYHWGIDTSFQRWEVDTAYDVSSTIHRVFVRSGTESAPDGGADASLTDASDDAAPPSDAAIDAPATFASCQELKNYDATLPSGLYTITLGSGQTEKVYCDMALDGGGWTGFFAGYNGSRNFFAKFEDPPDVCPSPLDHCLRHLPASLSPSEFAATCGAAAITFTITPTALTYFQAGTQAAWQPLGNVHALNGANPAFARSLWTGDGYTTSWVIADDSDTTGFSTFSTSSSGVEPGYFDFCNGVSEGPGGSAIRLMYR